MPVPIRVPILRTKLFIPTPRPSLITRARLIELLNTGLHRKLTLISAPAGFGKTTLVSSWLSGCGRPVAWLSLDEGDSDSTRFLTHLIAAVQTIAQEVDGAEIGSRALDLLHSSQPTAIQSILTALLNDIVDAPNPFILVLDDYHTLDAPVIDEALAFLLEHLPPQLHLAITTREDPNLPLARMRVRNQLTELRASDLRFTTDEAGAFLKEVMGLDLTDDNIAALESRTEGWVAGLQMAALSMQGQVDLSQFIQAFTGSNRFVLDYLMEEVLRKQSDEVRTFLLQTSILDRLCGSLCDSVTGQQNGEGMLESLERANLFVIPIDDQRQWYRYHHLFAEVLQARLLKEQPAQATNAQIHALQIHAPQLNQRASAWYESNDLVPQAIHHSIAAQDYESAAKLVERVWRLFDRGNQGSQVEAWLEAIPDDLVQTRPMLNTAYAWNLMNQSKFDAAEAHLDQAERMDELSNAENADEMLPILIAGARAYLAQAKGDFPGSIAYAQRALAMLPDDDYVERAIPASLLGLASWAEGDLELTYQAFYDVKAGFQKADKIDDALEIGYVLADIRRTQGRLRAALNEYSQVLQLTQPETNNGKPATRGVASLYMGLSEVHCEQGDLTAAQTALGNSEAFVNATGLQFPDWPHRFHIAKARLAALRGNLDDALRLLDKAEQVYYQSPLPNVRPISALKARIWLRQGRLFEVQEWANSRELSATDELSYLREFEHITLAQLLIAQAQIDHTDESLNEAINLLDRLWQYAEKGRRSGSIIEIQIQQSLAYAVRGDDAAALAALTDALTIAKPDGYISLFVEEGLPMVQLLKLTAKQDLFPRYVEKLLAAFDVLNSQPNSRTQPLAEPLSDRELEILRLIAAGKKNQEIADELIISLNTVRYHTKNIFGKLGVNKRTQAVAQSQTLGLL